MKNFINKIWKKLLIIIGVVCLLVNIYLKFITPATIIRDYPENGKNIESDFIDNFTQIADNTVEKGDEASTDISASISNETGLDQKWVKTGILFIGAILVISIMSALFDKKGAKKKK